MASSARSSEREERRRSALLTTKLHPPTARNQWVARTRLLELLRPEPGVRLTAVVAPAGSGKTTLLGTWYEVESTRRPVAWLSLDERDNDAMVLWTHALEALRQACPALETVRSPERHGPAHIVDVFLPELVNGLVEQGDAALVLDDFHRLVRGPSRESVAWLVEHAPSSFQLVVSTRIEPDLQTAALRARGELLEVRADDLAFTVTEADDFLNARLALGLEGDDVNELVERTDGWAAGLYLAALSLRSAEDRHAFVSRYSGASRHVVDFLVDEVLEGHDPAMQTLMLRCSVLERLSGPLCDALLEQDGSAEQLRELARTNLFLIPLDDEGRWYRFHHLFAQLLRVELERREPGLAGELHRRASAWYRAKHAIDDAVEHALAAGEFDEAADLIVTSWFVYADSARQATVFGWLDRLPSELIRRDSRLLLVSAWMHGYSGSREAAKEAVAAVERLGELHAGPLPDGFSSVEASLAALTGSLPWLDIGVRLASVRRAAELEGPSSPWRTTICFLAGLHLYLSDELDEAEHWLAEVSELAGSGGTGLSAESLIGSLTIRSLIAGEQGRVEDQVRLALVAASHVRERGHDHADHEVALASAIDAEGDHEEAFRLFERAISALELGDYPLLLADGLIRYAAALRAQGQTERASPVVARAKSIMESYADPGRLLLRRLAALEHPVRSSRKTNGTALSERELRILRMLGGRLSERDIGRELYLSHNTVHSHTKSIYRKLGVSSRTEALDHARELGLI